MDSEEFAELQAFERYFEPIGEDRADLRAGVIAYHASSAFGGSGGRTIRDCSLKFKEPTFTDDDGAERERRIRLNLETMRAAQQARKARKSK